MTMDPRRVQRVLYNLLQNSLRHTPPDGTIVIRAKDVGAQVQVDVTDTGKESLSKSSPIYSSGRTEPTGPDQEVRAELGWA